MEQVLEKLLESVPKARVLRLFLQNPDAFFSLPEVRGMTKLRTPTARSEISKLKKLGILGEKSVQREFPSRHRKNPRMKKVTVYFADASFPLFRELQGVIHKGSITSRATLLRRIKSLGRVKLAVASGVFMGNDLARTDLLLVGDNITKRKIDNFVKSIESDVGKTIKYTVMDTPEFKYRLDMYDRFLRDILEYPHEKLIDKFGL